MSMLNLKFLRCLHSILKDITVFLCVALPVVYCVSLMFLIYAIDNNFMLVFYYAIRIMAMVSAAASVCIVSTIGLGLYVNERR